MNGSNIRIKLNDGSVYAVILIVEVGKAENRDREDSYTLCYDEAQQHYLLFYNLKAVDDPEAKYVAPYNFCFASRRKKQSKSYERLVEVIHTEVQKRYQKENVAKIVLFDKEHDNPATQSLNRLISSLYTMDLYPKPWNSRLMTLITYSNESIRKEETNDDIFKIQEET